MSVLYNEIDSFAASWLEHLIEEGVIANGVVDRRSIDELEPWYLRLFDQVHFFAGVGIWSYALRCAGVPDDYPIWTGSCPCQPFSGAGKQLGFDDPRHKWPAWFRLIKECRPRRIIGEQVDKARSWVDLVSSDLENHNYAFAALDIPAAGFAGAHRRQRFYWVADADDPKWGTDGPRWDERNGSAAGWIEGHGYAGNGGYDGVGLADAHGGFAGNRGLQPGGEHRQFASDGRAISRPVGSPTGRGRGEFGGSLVQGNGGHADGPGVYGSVGYAERGGASQFGPPGTWGWRPEPGGTSGISTRARPRGEPGPARLSDTELAIVRSPGRRPQGGTAQQSSGSPGPGLDWLLCRDSRWRPVEPGTSPLVTSYPNRMGLLRGYGNALDAAAATEFIGAYMEARAELFE